MDLLTLILAGTIPNQKLTLPLLAQLGMQCRISRHLTFGLFQIASVLWVSTFAGLDTWWNRTHLFYETNCPMVYVKFASDD